jgi:hypothetical protein
VTLNALLAWTDPVPPLPRSPEPASDPLRLAGGHAPGGRSPSIDHDTRARRIERWERIGLGIRLAYNPGRADVVRLWLATGRQLSRDGGMQEIPMLARSLQRLLQTAEDPALPWAWRHVCLDHVARPWARLQFLLAGQADALLGHVAARIALAGDALGLPGRPR